MIEWWVACAAGIVVLIATSADVIGTLVVPRSVDSKISHAADVGVDLVFLQMAKRVSTYERRDRVLGWQGPVALIVRLSVWIALYVLGFAAVMLPIQRGNLRAAFSEAGSSMFTLGYSVPQGTSSTTIAYAAAFTGLIVVGLQIGYLPTLYAAFNRRENLVTLLISRAGVPAWGPEILARTQWGILGADMVPLLNLLYNQWEAWAAELAESHTTYLTLVRLRSPRPMSHWLTALLAVMDSAAIHLAVAPETEPKLTARLCLRMGFVAMNQIGTTMRLTVNDDPDPDAPISVSKQEFLDAAHMLAALGYPMDRTPEEAWPHFRGWRVNYDHVAMALAKAVDAPPTLWSGDRRWPSSPIAPHRPANRQPTVAPEELE